MYIRKWLSKTKDRAYIEVNNYGLTVGSWGNEIYMGLKPYTEAERKTIIEKLDTLINALSEAKNYAIKVNLEFED